ncbi:MAG: GIY-YIG nuclease family protein [Candidatus Poribacteria bacterium]|nr:GIY-YIG nuclease family protein [Candidatus Poribacteria bacterium]
MDTLTHKAMYLPILDILDRASDPISGKDIASQIEKERQDRFAPTDDEWERMQEKLDSGQTRFGNTVSWGLSYLKISGLLQTPKRGHYEITEKGREFLESPDGLLDFIAQKSKERQEETKKRKAQGPLKHGTSQKATPSTDDWRSDRGTKRKMSDTYLEEVKSALNKDETRLGDVWRLREKELGPKEIAEELGVRSDAWVYATRQSISVIVDGVMPTKGVAEECGRNARGLAKRYRDSFSSTTFSKLQERADKCDRIARSTKRGKAEPKPKSQTSAAEKMDIPGIYVYSLPHFLKHPVEVSERDETDNRTYCKVGMSQSTKKRVRNQATTALPEPIVLLRIYETPSGMDIAEVERRIHRNLEAAGHIRNPGQGPGQEWFLTNLKFLDSIAEDRGLKIRPVENE